jgi:hypothetical protein
MQTEYADVVDEYAHTDGNGLNMVPLFAAPAQNSPDSTSTTVAPHTSAPPLTMQETQFVAGGGTNELDELRLALSAGGESKEYVAVAPEHSVADVRSSLPVGDVLSAFPANRSVPPPPPAYLTTAGTGTAAIPSGIKRNKTPHHGLSMKERGLPPPAFVAPPTFDHVEIVTVNFRPIDRPLPPKTPTVTVFDAVAPSLALQTRPATKAAAIGGGARSVNAATFGERSVASLLRGFQIKEEDESL